ncbi:MAG: FecR family protein [Mucilaginibacter sp.]
MRKPISTDILKRYLDNTCTPAEKKAVWDWYESFGNDQDFASGLDKRDELELEEKIYANILNRIQQVEETQTVFTVLPKRHYRYALAAIAAMLVIGLFTVLYYDSGHKPVPPIANAPAKLKMLYVKNTTQRIYRAALPDGSILWLSPGAAIRYPEKFAEKFRMITFSGESFFEITKNPKRPFIINSHTIVTKVWGTSFRIRDLPGNKPAEVSVITGKVSVSRKDPAKAISAVLEQQDVMLYPNQNIKLFNGRKPARIERIQDKSSLKIWNRISLSFDNVSIRNIVPLLNDKFNVHIVVTNDKLNDYVLNADFTEFNLPEILQALQKTLGIDYAIGKTNIELK